MGSFSFPKTYRILNRTDFVNLNQSGERRYTKHFTVILKENGLGISRMGVTASKRIGNAVKRNRIKRLVREFFRQNRMALLQGYDFVIVARHNLDALDLRAIEKELGEIIFE